MAAPLPIELPIIVEGCVEETNTRKEVGFIWSMWHQTFVFNTWKAM
jgi:hypothetical protein